MTSGAIAARSSASRGGRSFFHRITPSGRLFSTGYFHARSRRFARVLGQPRLDQQSKLAPIMCEVLPTSGRLRAQRFGEPRRSLGGGGHLAVESCGKKSRPQQQRGEDVHEPVELAARPVASFSIAYAMKPNAMPSVMLTASGIITIVRNAGNRLRKSSQRMWRTLSIIITPTRTSAGATIG